MSVDMQIPGPGGGPTDVSPVERRVLEAMLETISADGYHAGSFARVAARAGLTAAELEDLYPDERVLLVDAMRYRDALGAATMPDAHADGRGLLRGFLDIIRYNVATPGTVELFTMLSAAATSPEHPGHDYFRERYAWLRGMVEDALEELEQEGELRRRADPATVATQALALLDGLQVQWLLDRRAIDMERLMRAFFNQHLYRKLEPARPLRLARD
ncbi:TetR/AcrR family transcriptional regulator [Demequina lignilytica]|uniref:TetR/AcrR family transcriptional regulator n=1 Tax=Demequina lignilytica TaxID=3051663 RepID=A0AB35MI26_9MICO|nr:TetR/AcrR family transcriptional regulator [Demequina sp. SYSU T0a273]MDN4483325.1 TetR/AcrR family transcriptional regulator [Demequina sp. SYSU T0a273]